MRDGLLTGAAPFDDVDAVFISHMHPDHFSVDEMILYLETHADVTVYAPQQAVELMRDAAANDGIFDRVVSVPLARLDAPLSYTEGDLTIDVVRIPHAGWPARADVSNLVWRVTLSDGVTVMHLGDADPDDAHFAPHALHWQKTRTDRAYPPYWFFAMGDGPVLIAERLNTAGATGVHVPMELPADLFVSGADFLHRPGETRALSKDDPE
jgi:L-ascorbate metabolism protein UlaG (beta-lactamase superfamily)